MEKSRVKWATCERKVDRSTLLGRPVEREFEQPMNTHM